MEEEFLIYEEHIGYRLDKLLTEIMEEQTRSFIQNLIKNGDVLVNDAKVKAGYKCQEGDLITWNIPEPKELEDILPEDLNLNIVYEDDDVVVVDKPSGMVVHPAHGHTTGTLVNGLLFHIKDLSTINGVRRPGIVHRIDKDTSGLLMVAKNDEAHASLSKQLEEKTVNRIYIGLCVGNITPSGGTVVAPVGRSNSDRKKMAVIKNGKKATTHFEVTEYIGDFSLVEFKLETGRTHQIRVHMQYIGHPLVGDPLYGQRRYISTTLGQYLHAKTLGFNHPKTGEYLEFSSDIPKYFENKINEIKTI